MKSRSLAFLILIILAISSTVSASPYDKRIEKSFKVKRGGALFLESEKGSIEVRSHSSENVEVVVLLDAKTSNRDRAEVWLEDFEVTFEHRGSDVDIRGEWRGGSSRRCNHLRVEYRMTVPEEYNLDLHTAGGSIDVDDLTGRIKLSTSGGGISLGEIDGDVDAKTSGGSISLEQASGRAFVHTSGGSITLGEIGGSTNARTSGGSIVVDGVNGDLDAKSSGGSLRLHNVTGNLNARTSGGSIRADLLNQITAPVILETSGGGITLTVPDNFKADLDASTSGGRVIADVPIMVRGTIRKSSLKGKINGGGHRVRIKTSGGNIKIREN